jgi:hypothetical protein
MSFWEKDYDALFITSYYKNPHMHSREDTVDKINQQFFLRAAHLLVGMMVTLANEKAH